MDSHQQLPPGGDRNRGPTFIAVTSVLTVFSSITILLRLYTRTQLVRSLGWDDYTVFIAWALGWLGLACHVVEANHGTGRHAAYVSTSNLQVIKRWSLVSQTQQISAVTFTKMSATLLLIRLIAGTTTKTLRLSLYALMIVFVTIALATIFATWLQCIPIDAVWDKGVDGRCLHAHQILAFFYTLNAFTILTDVICAAFPILVLQRLQMNRRKKIGLSIVMSLGLITAACAAVKTSYLGGIRSKDYSWDSLNVSMWAIIEEDVGIIACSIPTLYPLVRSTLKSRKSGNPEATPKSTFAPSWDSKRARILGQQQHPASNSGKPRSETASEERILGPVRDGIRKTTDIRLDYSSHKRKQDEYIEMV